MPNYLTELELNSIKGLMHYLNESFIGGELDAEVKLTDANGEHAATLKWTQHTQTYVMEFGNE